MDYLFFDIECCDGKNICEFGYVIADENLNPLKKDIILVNPDAPFNLGWGKGPQLYYPFKRYYKSGTFDKHYAEIKRLFDKKDRTVVGHATFNDAKFLAAACRRYGLRGVAVSYMDTQKILRKMLPDKGTVSLDKACAALSADSGKILHKSDDDAAMTMEVFMKMSALEGLSLNDFILKYADCGGNVSEEGEVTDADVITFADRLRRARQDRTNRLNTNNRKVLEAFVSVVRATDKKENALMRGKKVSFSRNYEKDHFREMMAFIQLLKNNGARYCTSPEKCDFFVRYDVCCEDGTMKECSRLKTALNASAEKGRPRIITVQQLSECLGTEEKALKNNPFPSDRVFERQKDKGLKSVKHPL